MPTRDALGTIRNGCRYYKELAEARNQLREVRQRFPQARLVEYRLGLAIQYYNSGPYFPELELTPKEG